MLAIPAIDYHLSYSLENQIQLIGTHHCYLRFSKLSTLSFISKHLLLDNISFVLCINLAFRNRFNSLYSFLFKYIVKQQHAGIRQFVKFLRKKKCTKLVSMKSSLPTLQSFSFLFNIYELLL